MESALEGPERAPGPAGVGREGRRVRRGRPALAGRRLQLSRAQNNGQAVGEEDWEEGSRVSRKGETKEPSADCHLHVTRSAPPPPFFLPSPCSCSCGPRRAHCTHRCWVSALRFRLLGGGAAHRGCLNLWLRTRVQGLGRAARRRGAWERGRAAKRPRDANHRAQPAWPPLRPCSALRTACLTRALGPPGVRELGRHERLGARPRETLCSSRLPGPGPGRAFDLGKRGPSSIPPFPPSSQA